MEILYNPHDKRHKSVRGPLKEGEKAQIRIALSEELAAEGVSLVVLRDGEEEPCLVSQMTPCASPPKTQNFLIGRKEPNKINGEKQSWFETWVSFSQRGLYFYHFITGKSKKIKRANTRGDAAVIDEFSTAVWQLSVYDPCFTTPAWLQGGIMYQIFPDRFAKKGRCTTRFSDRLLREDWGGLPNYLPDAQGKIRNDDFFGGNLAGIIAAIPYLQRLSVRAIYLNPIFEAHENHRYNTADYRKLDDLLGSEEDFEALCQAAEAAGIRVILDGVFSHTGADSVYFNKNARYGSGGAFLDPYSPYRNWYRFSHWPDRYACWWGIDTLPETQENDPGFLEFITGEEGVLALWQQRGAAGWRLDVADELPEEFLRAVRRRVKQQDPQALLIGEVWEDASNKISYGYRRHYLLGEELDGVMNYPFRTGILGFLLRGEDLSETVDLLTEHYPSPALAASLTLLSTHDTARLLTILGGELPSGREVQSRYRLDDVQRRRGISLAKLAFFLAYFLPGVPVIYYGDEIGMEGGEDPFNRGCFDPDGGSAGLMLFVERLGKLRSRLAVLQQGVYETLWFDAQHYLFSRGEGAQRVLAAVNRSSEPWKVPFFDEKEWKTVLGELCDGKMAAMDAVAFVRAGDDTQ